VRVSLQGPRARAGDVAGSTQGSWTGTDPSGEVCVRHEIVDPASGEGLPADRGTEGMAAEDAVRAGEGLHQKIEVGDAPFDEGHRRGCSIFSRRPVARLSMMTTS